MNWRINEWGMALAEQEWLAFQRRWNKSYGDYAPLPKQPMNAEQAKEYLTEKRDCGCVLNWWASPPSGFSCSSHIGMCGGGMPSFFLYANTILRGETK